MSFLAAERDRRVVPRWRNSGTTAASGELASLVGARQPLGGEHHFDEKVLDWEERPTLATAAELVAAAVVMSHEPEARRAAEFLLAHEGSVTEQVRQLAEHVLGLPHQHDPGVWLHIAPADVYQRIRRFRERLRNDPRDALALADISREYASIGLHSKSVRAMEIALKLLPTNRFLLRAAARLHVHLGDPDRARGILLGQPRTRRDPWLLSAEIAVATVAGRTSRFIKEGRGMVEGHEFAPIHLAELASAVGTIDLIAGKSKDARKLFRQSLVSPTDNAVAQAVWASRHLASFELDSQQFQLPRSYEARAWRDFWMDDWYGAMEECNQWLFDEPYSSRPATLGSFVASVALQDFDGAERIAGFGLKANPDDPTLLNNLAFSLASQNKLIEARAAFARIQRQSLQPETEIVVTATEGLLHFRAGDPERGRALYQKTMEEAGRTQQHRLRALASVFLAREENLTGSDNAAAAVARAAEECMRQPDHVLQTLFETIVQKKAIASSCKQK